MESPYNLIIAVNEALSVLSWHENLPKDEIPPRHIWWSGDLLDEWFRTVDRKRKEKHGGRQSTYDAADDAPMVGNKLIDEQMIPR